MGTRDDDSPADGPTWGPSAEDRAPRLATALPDAAPTPTPARPTLAPADRTDAIALLVDGTKPSLVASMLVGRGYPPDAAQQLALALAEKHARPRARVAAPVTEPDRAPDAAAEPPPAAARSSTAGLANILFGLVFVVGGASGQLALRGTGSSIALIAVGVGLLVWGVAQRFR